MSQAETRFPRARRLTRPDEYARVFEKSRRLADNLFTILYRANELSWPRLGLAISRKHVRTAVARHRIKRHVRESFRLHQHLVTGFDVVVLARPGLHSRDNAEVRASLGRHWQRIHEQCKGF